MTHTRKSVLLVAAAVLAWTPSAFAQREDVRRDGPKMKAAFKAVVAAAGDCVVRVRSDGKDAALGTVVGADGWIVTKASELKAPVTVMLRDGRSFEAKLVGVADADDLAMLKIDATGLKPVQWRDSQSADVGDWVASPGLGELPQAVGVVGVKTRKMARRDWPFAPNPNGGYLGIRLDTGDKGVKVVEVTGGSAAEKAGMKKDDVIVAVNGHATPDPEHLLEQMQKYKVDDTVTMKLRRGDDEMELKVKLGKRPPNTDRADFQNRLGNDLSVKRTGFPVVLQHDAVVKPVDCGGPLLDLDGKAVGVNIARGGRVETFAIPAEEVKALIPDLKSGKLSPDAAGPNEAETRLARARDAYEKAVREKQAADDKAKEAKAALDKAETERKAAEAKAKEAKAALDKAEAEAKKDK